MSSRKIRGVFFDLVGTLILPRAPIGSQYAAIATQHGVRADPAALDAAFGRAMAAAPPIVACHESPEAAAEAEREWWHRLVSGIVAECGVDGLSSPSRFDRYFDDLYLHFATSAAWALYDDVLPALEELRSTGVAAGLITNYDSRVYRLLDSLGLTPWLDSVTIPAIAGSSKPDARIFAFALAQKGLAPGQAAHVGDSVEEDYRAAEDAGLVAVLLDRDDRHAAVTHMRRARGLDEALARVQRASGHA